MQIEANIVDLHNRRIFFGTCTFAGKTIDAVQEQGDERRGFPYLMPGFIDAHVHIESSMLTPSEFARLAVRHGTVATVSDPHEIANVLGIAGIEYMIDDAARTPFKFHFGAPSCVPATAFETAGDIIDSAGIRDLLERDDILYLAEMMNFPGVLHNDPEVIAKIEAAKACGKPVDGHAPGLTGQAAETYIAAGISTDHECVTYDEALFKLQHGMKIIIREGSAAKNFEALQPLIGEYPDRVMLCSDDKHPDDLVKGHIDQLAACAVARGHGVLDVLTAACVNPVWHYGLPVGTLRPGEPADCILVNDLTNFKVLRTYIDGQMVFGDDALHLQRNPPSVINRFNVSRKSEADLALSAGTSRARVIEAVDGALITRSRTMEVRVEMGEVTADTGRDILKIAVVNRYANATPAVALVNGFGLQQGAIASSVAHDSHNIVAVGADDVSLVRAINAVIDARGGISAVLGEETLLLPLPVAGIISDLPGEEVAGLYTEIDAFVRNELGSGLGAPFMTLSFMALLVIPSLKLSDKGLFDGDKFAFTKVFAGEK